MAANTDHMSTVVDGELPPSPQSSTATPQLLFKKHKVLPHPGRDASTGPRGPRPMVPTQRQDQTAATAAALNGALSAYASSADVQFSPRTLKHYAKKTRSGPDLPPTPPAHSRTSSSSYSALPSSTTSVQSPDRSAEDIQMKPTMPATPTKQMSPPTPDVTPPSATDPDNRVRGVPVRAFVRDREISKGTNSSHAESFKTAREDASSGDEEVGIDGRSTLRSIAPSTRTSESTVRCLFVSNGIDEAAQNVNGINGAMPTRTIQGATTSKRQSQAIGLGLGLESSSDRSLTPKSKHGAANLDVEWSASRNDEAVRKWDGNPDRNAVARKRQRPLPNTTGPRRKEVVEDVTVSQTNTAQAVRSMSLPKRILTFPSPNESPAQPMQQPKQRQSLVSTSPTTAPMAPLSTSPGSERDHHVSTISSKSTVSTVVEAYLVDTPPQRRRTLRHVRKQVGLRDSISDMSPTSSAPTSILDEGNRQQQRRLTANRSDNRQEKTLSGITVASVGSRSARREILKAGAIPVLVVPNRRSSATFTSREPSLRSTSSRHSKTNQSVNSVPVSQFSSVKSKEYPPSVDRTSRQRSRAYSESDGSAPGDQRTIDYAPVVPRRTSSLSAPTSRNASRSGSLTTESLKALDKLQSQHQAKQLAQRLALSQLSREDNLVKSSAEVTPVSTEVIKAETSLHTFGMSPPKVNVEEASPVEHGKNGLYDDHSHACLRSPTQHGEVLHRHLSPQNVPFSPASVDTATSHHSHAEVSEALAVSIYAHQNTSILVVDHSNRPSESSDGSQPDRMTDSTGSSGSKVEMASFGPPPSSTSRKQQSTVPNYRRLQRADPATPTRIHPYPLLMDDIDSPLRNPRVPPTPPAPAAPPAINFIPATPSGMTPATEKEPQMGNLGDEELENKPQSSVSRVFNRVMHRGRRTDYGPSASRSTGLLERTVSLSKLVQRKTSLRRSKSLDRDKKRPVFDHAPADETKLHPFWRPASFQMGDDYGHMHDSESDSDSSDSDPDEEYYRYPPVDNRPHGPRGPPMSHVSQGPRRSLSQRMKRTFAIMPINDSFDSYPGTSDDAPERRTVRRTPSGNLRVVKHRNSVDSLGRHRGPEARSYASSQQPSYQSHQGKSWKTTLLRTPSLRKKETEVEDETMTSSRGHDKHVVFSKFGENRLQSIPRRFSERRREKRSNELRRKISAPREVRDGVGDVIRHSNYRDAFTQAQMSSEPTA